jgi:biotin operon repressor
MTTKISDADLGKALRVILTAEAQVRTTVTNGVSAKPVKAVAAAAKAPKAVKAKAAKPVVAKPVVAKALKGLGRKKTAPAEASNGNGASMSPSAQKTLEQLKLNAGNVISGKELAEAAGISSSSVAVAIKQLREHGIDVVGKRGKTGGGYSLS